MTFLFLALAAYASDLPNYKSEILARVNGSSSYNMPSYSSISNSSPSLNDAGDVTFKFLSDDFAIWHKKSNEINGRIIHSVQKDKIISDPKMLENGDILFTLFDEFSNDGLFLYDKDLQKVNNVFSSKNVTALNSAQSFSQNQFFFRSTDDNNNRYFIQFSQGVLTHVADEENGYSYLFGPSINKSLQWLFKVRLGEKFNYSEESSDQLILLKPSFTSLGQRTYLKTIIAEDCDSNVLSPFQSFDNSPSLSNSGLITFTATLKNKNRIIMAVKENKYFIVAQEKQGGISQIETFAPKINDQGYVVFRAKDEKGLRGIFIVNPFADKPHIKKLISEGDVILSDQGSMAILKNNQYPGFSGNVDLNNKNEIVFSTILATQDQNSIFGSAIYKLHPLD